MSCKQAKISDCVIFGHSDTTSMILEVWKKSGGDGGNLMVNIIDDGDISYGNNVDDGDISYRNNVGVDNDDYSN